MIFKEGVTILGVQPELVLSLTACETAWNGWAELQSWNDGVVFPMRVSSVTDGEHMRASLHKAGAAADISTTWFVEMGYLLPRTTRQWDELAAAMQSMVPDACDVVLEKNHIHVEYQPK